jgi:hypothetical protein
MELYLHSPITPSWRGAQLKQGGGGKEEAYNILILKRVGRCPLGRLRKKSDDIKI